MDVQQILDQVREATGPKHVFGEPIHEGEALLIPVARVRGGAGGGGNDQGGERSGQGVGFGITATPSGAFVYKNGQLSWRPVIDVNRVILGAQLLAGLALIAVARIVGGRRLRARRWRLF